MAIDLSAHIDQQLTVTGTARTGAGGALVSVEKVPIYIEDLEAWDDELEGRPVEVTGVLRRRPSMVPQEGPHSHGLGSTWALDDASWSQV